LTVSRRSEGQHQAHRGGERDGGGIGCSYSPGNPAGCVNTSWQNLYQLRLITAQGPNPNQSTYDVADVLVSGDTWTQVYRLW
jgi:hypothetical protein